MAALTDDFLVVITSYFCSITVEQFQYGFSQDPARNLAATAQQPSRDNQSLSNNCFCLFSMFLPYLVWCLVRGRLAFMVMLNCSWSWCFAENVENLWAIVDDTHGCSPSLWAPHVSIQFQYSWINHTQWTFHILTVRNSAYFEWMDVKVQVEENMMWLW